MALAVLFGVTGCTATVTTTTSTGSTPGTTPTATATATPTSAPPTATPITAPPHAFAWYQLDAAKVPQIWASINGGVPHQITHVAPDGSACDDQIAWSLPVFSPDLAHIVASMGSYGCGDGDLQGTVSVITVSSGAVANVPGSGVTNTIRTSQRDSGWLDNHTIWYLTFNGLYRYPLGAGSPTHVSSLGGAPVEEAVLRGTTLFYEYGTLPIGGASGSQHVRRFDMSTSSILPGTISLGTEGTCACSPGDFRTPGWDASPDGSHVAYEVVTPSNSMPGGITSSKFYYANADGSGASQIAHAVVANQIARLLISPNGQLIALAAALPSPSVITASVSSPGNSGDPNLRFYHPDAVDYPVWKWDSSQFWAATEEVGGQGTTAKIYRYTVSGSSSTLAQSGALNPWYTIGA